MKNDSIFRSVLIVLLTAIVALLGVLIATYSNNSNSQQFADNAPDEQIVEQPIESDFEAPAQEPELPVSQSVTTSPDLKWARVSGPVKTIHDTKVNTDYDGEQTTIYRSLSFDRNGQLIPDKSKHLTYTRNSAGQITKEVEIEYEDGRKYTTISAYKYNDDGYIKYESIQFKPDLGDTYVDYYNYKLNDKGWILSAKVKSEGDGEFHSNLSFSYSNLDSYGNWRKYVMRQRIEELDESYTAVCTRQITYWD